MKVPVPVQLSPDEVARYPDAAGATDALASVLGVDVERVLLTNGGAEAIALVAAVDSPHLRLNLDLYHAQIGEGDLVDLCGRLRSRIQGPDL